MRPASTDNSKFELIVLGTLAALTLTLVIVGAIRWPDTAGALMAGVGAIGLIGVVTAALVMVRLRSLASRLSLLEREQSTAVETPTWVDRLEHILIESRDASVMSDEARRIVLREREANVLRSMIEGCVSIGAFDRAERICADLESSERWSPEVQWGRDLIARARDAQAHGEANAALADFDDALARRDWSAAYREAARLRQMYADSRVNAELDVRIAEARNEHKQDLESQFLEASSRDDVDTAMEVLRELDRYMTREEAERLSEHAQQIIARHRERLGATFRVAVQERRWSEAARVGNVIVADYPNTKMADEVRSMIDLIRTRATQAALSANSRG